MNKKTNEETYSSKTIDFVWSNTKIKLKKIYGQQEYTNWLKLLSFNSIKNNVLILNAPTKFMCDWISSHYGKKVLNTWREFDKSAKDISITVNEQTNNTLENQNKSKNNQQNIEKNNKTDLLNNLDPRFIFKDFIEHG